MKIHANGMPARVLLEKYVISMFQDWEISQIFEILRLNE